MGTINMNLFAMVLMLVIIWIKPSSATNQPTHPDSCLLTKLKNIFCCCQRKPYVETINKKEHFEKLQKSPFIMIIMNYLDLHDYVSMIQVSTQLYQIIPNQVGINHLFVQYTKLLQQQPAPLIAADIMMLQHYAQFLESRPIPDDYVKPFYLPEMSTEHQDIIRSTRVNVPVLAIMKINNGSCISSSVVNISQWKFCDHYFVKGNKHHINLWPENTLVHVNRLWLKYDKCNNLPNTISFIRDQNYIRVDNYVTEYKSNKKGYYQTFHNDKKVTDDLAMLFYYPYRK